MKIQDIFQDATLGERTTNYIQLANNIADDYGYAHSALSEHLSHGVQKDAIQNGWDAAEKKTHKFLYDNWRFEFELADIRDGKALLMTDFGTFGLTGDLTSDKLKAKGIGADDLPQYERWARWESFGFTKGEGLGARGQGKMIFMLASKDYTICYDSLRCDGSYRLGGSTAMETGCPVFHYDGETAKQLVRSQLGLEPLSHQGTRIIIVNPVEEIVEDIHNGNLLSFIEETWWPNIHKYGVEIIVKDSGEVKKAELPELFPICKEMPESKDFKTWVKDDKDFKKKQVKFKIKRLCVACCMQEEVDELYQGIACFRDGMKVDVVRFPDKAFRNKVFGYVEFEKDLEDELRVIEKPTHYAFKGPLWTSLRNLIEQELEAFGNKKLGLGIDTQALVNIQRSRAESRALSILRAVTKNWPISRWSKGVGGGGNGGSPYDKQVGVRLSDLFFPNPGNMPRLDYGQKMEGFNIVVFNKEEKAHNVVLSAFMLSGDTKILNIRNELFELKPKSDSVFPNNCVQISKSNFESPGEYRLRLNLTDTDTNVRLDEITRRIWVEMDPKLAGPFDVRRLKFTELPDTWKIDKRREWVLIDEGDDKYTLYYNLDHPAYLYSHETEAKLTAYLAELFLVGALELFIRQALVRKEKFANARETPLNLEIIASAAPLEVFSEYTLALSRLRGNMYELV